MLLCVVVPYLAPECLSIHIMMQHCVLCYMCLVVIILCKAGQFFHVLGFVLGCIHHLTIALETEPIISFFKLCIDDFVNLLFLIL